MTSESSARSRDCDDCDPQLIDCLKCEAEGIAAQATYNGDNQPALEAARLLYDTTRKSYREQRGALVLQVADLRHQIKHLAERIRCLIKQKRVVECVDAAYDHVMAELAGCGDVPGCCADEEFEFDTDCADLDDDELVKRITRYQAHVDRAHTCFDALTKEPADLVARLALRKSDVDGITATLATDAPTTDLRDVYATAKVAKYRVKHIWNGFDETRDYVECLCRALTCWTKGCAAVSVLLGAKAVADCRKAAEDARCAALRDHTVDAIITEYERICPERPCEDAAAADEDDPDDEEQARTGT